MANQIGFIRITLLLLKISWQKTDAWFYNWIGSISLASTGNLRYLWFQNFQFNPILHGGIKTIPPGWLLHANLQRMPWIGWFFMTLFLSTFERSWVGHFWGFLFVWSPVYLEKKLHTFPILMGPTIIFLIYTVHGHGNSLKAKHHLETTQIAWYIDKHFVSDCSSKYM